MIGVSASNPLPDSARRIVDARRDAESVVKVALAAIRDSERIEDYLPAFCAFATSLFDAEAEQALAIFNDEEAYKSFLEQDVTTRIVEGILPDQGLESVKANWSPKVAQLSIENEVGSEILSECRPDGTNAPARPEIQGVHAQHGDWENFAPLTVRFRLRFEKNALVRENLRQALERKSFYWLDRFSLRPPNAGPRQGIAEGTMPDPPLLSEATKRKLDLQLETVRDKQKLTEEELSDYDKERQRLLRMPANPPSHVRPLRPHLAARSVGLTQSVTAAEVRFRGIDWEYWSNWCSSGFGYEVYRDWLAFATRQVLDELSSIWKGRSAVTDQWFQATCAPAIEKALDVLVKRRIAQARDVETKRLERPSPKARTGTGNPVADEILTTKQTPEASRGHFAQHAEVIHRPSSTVVLSQDQQQRIKDAEGRLNESLEAHEKMREVIEPGEWSPVSLSPKAPRMADEVRKLDVDLRRFAIEVFNVLAEAAWVVQSMDVFRTRLQTHARQLLEWIPAKVNPKDLRSVDTAALEAAIQTEQSNWIRKAQREFPPAWMGDALAGVPPGLMEPQRSGFRERDQLNALDPFQQDATVRPARDTESNGPGDSSERRFKKTGEVWSLQYDGTSVSLPARIGMAYLQHLLRSPDRSFSCMELQAAVGANPDGRAMLDKKDEAELPVASSVEDEILDPTARKQYKERLAELEADLQKAERNNDIGQRERLTDEKESLLEELKAATGLAGRPRKFATDAEKARKAVSGAIRTALEVINKYHPELAKHLEDRIDRGARCCYRSDGIGWEV
jgi:hypothetical protein